MGSGGKQQARANTEAGNMQGDAASDVGNRQRDTALTASEMRASAIERAMNIQMNSGGGGINTGSQQRDVQEASDKAMAMQQDSYDQARDLLDPFTKVGDKSLEAIEKGATSEGFAARLDSIMDGDAYKNLRDQRGEEAGARAGAVGLNRSGAAMREAAQISTQTAMGLDNQLYQRQLNNVDIDQRASNQLMNYGQGFADRAGALTTSTAGKIAGLQTQQARSASAAASRRANINASGILGAANARADGLEASTYYETSGVMGAANARANGLIGAANARAQGKQNRFNNILGVANVATSAFTGWVGRTQPAAAAPAPGT